MALPDYKKRLKKDDTIVGGNNKTTNGVGKASFDDAFNAYKTQLELSKVDAKNEIAKSNRIASQYLDNYLKQYGLRGSGIGQTAYTNLAANQATNMANVNRDTAQNLENYRTSLNDKAITQGESLLTGMSNEQAKNYLDDLKKNTSISPDTLNYLNNYRQSVEYQNQGSLSDQRKAYLSQLKSMIDNKQVDSKKMNDYKEVYNEIYNAQDQESFNAALSKLEELEYTPYATSSKTNSTNTSVTNYENLTIDELLSKVKSGEINVGGNYQTFNVKTKDGGVATYEIGKNLKGNYIYNRVK